MTKGNEVGREYPPVIWEVQRCKFLEMAEAIGDNNPIYHDAKAAEINGYQDIPPVPTMSTVGAIWGKLVDRIFRDLKINADMALHGEEIYEYLRDYYPGDVLTGVPKVTSIKEKISKSGEKMRLINIEIMWRNQEGEDVLRETSLVIERLAL